MEIILLDHAEPGVYSYTNKERYEELVEYRLGDARLDDQVRTAQDIALAAWRALGCRDAGRVDLRCDTKGHPQFMEVNPLAGLHPTHSDLPILATALGISFVELIGQIIDSAIKRVKARGKSRLLPAQLTSLPETSFRLSLEER
jgi:D-alanine-D-alanine ligase